MSLVEICERYNISVRYYSPDSMEQFGLPLTGGGYATLIGGQLYILCDRTRPQEERRFIIAHELGHILLGHLTFRKKIWTYPARMEIEANLFAAVMIANDLHSQKGART